MDRYLSPRKIALKLEQFLAKNRDSLEITDVDLIVNVIKFFRELDKNDEVVDKKFINNLAIKISVDLMKFFLSASYLEFTNHW